MILPADLFIVHLARKPKDGFPPEYVENTFQAIQSTFRSLEMHSKRRYKIVISSVIREFKSFRNYKGFSITFPKILGAILDFNSRRSLILGGQFLKMHKMWVGTGILCKSCQTYIMIEAIPCFLQE